MGYILFLLVNATLFLRPSELFPELASVRIYEALIIACFAVSFPQVIEQLSPRSLERSPITICVFVFWLCCGLSHVMQGELALAGESMYKFFKVVVYYLLLVGLVNTPSRLRTFLCALTLFVAVLTTVAVLRYGEVITIVPPPLEKKENPRVERRASVKDDDGTSPTVQDTHFDPASGESITVFRLRGTGIFNDPNDLCLALTFGLFLCFWGLSEPDFGLGRFLFLVPLALFLFALRLTYSRGGLLGLVAGLGVLFACRYGWKRTIYLCAPALVVLLALFGGRMTSISTSESTAQTRLMTWRDGLVLFKENPVFGVGMDRFHEFAVQVAHNSYLHAFSELGVVGGILFIFMFCYAFWILQQVRQHQILDPGLKRLLPFLIAMIVAFAGGIFMLSRTYDVPTYTMLGLATVYLRMVPVSPSLETIRGEHSLFLRSLGMSFAFLAALYVMVNALVQ